MTPRTTLAIAAAGTLVPLAHAQVNVAPTKANGTFISGAGIPANDFTADTDAVGVYLKPRARQNGQPLLLDGDTYIVRAGQAPSSTASWWSFDFQFTPRPGDTVGGQNYNLTLEFDTDPSPATNFVTISQPIFDADADPSNSWDENDGFFVNPGPGAWSDDSIAYVFSQSWRPDFGFLAGSILPPGDYQLRFSAAPVGGNTDAMTVSTTVNVRVVPTGTASVTLDAQDACLNAGEGQLVVDVNLIDPQDEIVGGQFFLSYDPTKLDFVSADPGDAPFTSQVFESVDEIAGEINYAVGTPSSAGSTIAGTMTRLTFNTLGDFCAEDALVAFRTGPLPSRLTTVASVDIQPATADLGVVTKDSGAPSIAAPDDVFSFADAGACSTTLDFTDHFDDTVDTAPAQTAGAWYPDRYPPSAFESVDYLGDSRLHIGISASDAQANRPPAYSSSFYNTQGRKLDVNIPVGQKISARLLVPSDWSSQTRRSDIWATTFDSADAVSGFPILGFVANDPTDPSLRFRFFTQNGWHDMGLPAGFSFDRWWTLEVELTSGAYIARVIDDNGDTVLSYTDPLVYGSVRIGNIIMQAYNYGDTYDVYWDDVTTAPAGPVATDGCSGVQVTYARSDDPQLSLSDPFPAGTTTTVAWTATDACGNSTTTYQNVTVDADSLLDVAVQLQSVVSGTFDRCITFTLSPSNGDPDVSVSQTLTFVDGIAVDTVPVPCGEYDCVTARDGLHSLRSTDNDDFAIAGVVYTADFTGADELIGGNLNGDTYIDILDFGAFIGQFGSAVAIDTPCGFSPTPHADITGDGLVGSGDFTFISINFLQFNEPNCDGIMLSDAHAPGVAWHTPMPNPLASVDVSDLDAMGLASMRESDLNADGVIDAGDIAAFMGGARPDHVADVDRNGRVDFFDLAAELHRFGQAADAPYDLDGDGVVTVGDVYFVRDRMGMSFAH